MKWQIKKFRRPSGARATWRNLIIVFALIFLVALGYYAYLFGQIQSTAKRAADNLPATDPARLDEKKLDEALKLLSAKQAAFAELSSSPAAIIDPSR